MASVRFKSAFLFGLGLTPLWAGAQGVVHIEFPVTHRFATFVASKLPEAMPRVLDEHVGTATQVQVPATGDLYVWDRDSGNVAMKPVSKAGPVWKISEKDFTLIGEATVHVDHQGRPVATAQVLMKDKGREQSQLVDASARGDAKFHLIKPGEILVTVKYRAGGADATPLKQIFTLEMQRGTPVPVLSVSVPEAAETVATAPVARTSGVPPAQGPTRTSPIGNAVVYLAGLGIAGYAGYWMYQRAKKDPKWVADRMKKLGVDLPEPASAAAEGEPLPDLEPPQPKPPTKILLGDAEPMAPPLGSAAPARASVEPRLVRDTGEFAALPEGETVVGREEGLGLSLVGEDSVSRRHASVVRTGTQLKVRDLQSTNGTYVNGRKVDSETDLQLGDELQFGAVRFRVQ